MTDRKKYYPEIANALIWAALIIATSLITADVLSSDKAFMLMILQIAGWFATNGLVKTKTLTAREEWACVKKLFSRGN